MSALPDNWEEWPPLAQLELLAEYRRMWFLQHPDLFVVDVLGESIYSKQVEILRSVGVNRRTAVPSCFESGKGLALDTKLPTPAGWTTMGAVEPGDWLLDEQGRPTRVLAATPIWTRDCYRVTFGDGAELVTDDGHLWATISQTVRHRTLVSHRGTGDWRDSWALAEVNSTPALSRDLHTKHGMRQHVVPTCRPLDLPEAELPMDAYVLGAWLGDGTTVRAEITCEDQEILDEIRAAGWTTRPRVNPLTHGLGSPTGTGQATLGAVGVLGNKHIPIAYLRASAPQRLALLQGLMDTDGHADHRGRCSIDLTHRRLAHDTAELIRTFGWRARIRDRAARIYGREVGRRYRITFRPDRCCFRLPRKAARCAVPRGIQGSALTVRSIRSIERTETVPTRCLEVDSPSHLYLAGEHFIPTHNSFIAARAACWWLEAHPPGEAFVVSTAPTGPQVRAILWREVNRAHARGRRGPEGDQVEPPAQRPTLIGRVNQTEWFVGNELVAYGRKPDEHNPDAFAGIHAPAVLVIIDEANGVPESLFEASEGLIANEDSRILAIGNPNSANTHFSGICKPGTSWHVITISAYDTPNFTGEILPDRVLRSLVGATWVREQIVKWGLTHPYVVAKVFGKFPEDNRRSVVPLSYVRARQLGSPEMLGEPMTEEEKLALEPVDLGVDIGASEEGDPTVIYEIRGGRPCRYWTVQSNEEGVVVGSIVQAIGETRARRVKVDSIGVGWGVASHLGALAAEGVHQAEVIPVNVALPGHDPEHFPNIRSEMWWMVRDLCRARAVDLSDVDEDTVAELISAEYKPDGRGRNVVEPKVEIKKRLHRSTDRADALLLGLYEPPQDEEGVVTWEPDYSISPF